MPCIHDSVAVTQIRQIRLNMPTLAANWKRHLGGIPVLSGGIPRLIQWLHWGGYDSPASGRVKSTSAPTASVDMNGQEC